MLGAFLYACGREIIRRKYQGYFRGVVQVGSEATTWTPSIRPSSCFSFSAMPLANQCRFIVRLMVAFFRGAILAVIRRVTSQSSCIISLPGHCLVALLCNHLPRGFLCRRLSLSCGAIQAAVPHYTSCRAMPLSLCAGLFPKIHFCSKMRKSVHGIEFQFGYTN